LKFEKYVKYVFSNTGGNAHKAIQEWGLAHFFQLSETPLTQQLQAKCRSIKL